MDGIGIGRLGHSRTFAQHHDIILLKREQGVGIDHDSILKLPLKLLERFGLGVLQHLHDMRMGPDHHGLLAGCPSDSADIAKNIVHHRECGSGIAATVTIGADVGERPE